MIYLITGNKKERKSFILKICEQQMLDLRQIQYFYSNDFSDTLFENIIPYNIGLFGERECFIINDSLCDLPIKTIIKEYKETEHILIFSEQFVLKKDREAFEKIGANIKLFEKEVEQKKEKFNTFALADLLGGRDKKKLWLAFHKAVNDGVSIEEIHGILFWQLKNLALVKTSNSNPGMNDFVYSKNKSFARNFSIKEVQDFSERMTKIFHSRDTYRTLEIDLEKFILDL